MSLSDGSGDNFPTASSLRGGGGQKSASVRNGEETVAPVLYTDGTDICSRLCFEFASPHCSLSLSEDGIINIVGGTHAPMNTKVLFAFSGGFAPRNRLGKYVLCIGMSLRTLLPLLKLSQCFSLTQHISKNAKLKVKIFTLAILFVV